VVAMRHCTLLAEVGNSRSVEGAGIRLVGVGVGSRLPAAEVWRKEPGRSRSPEAEASGSLYMTCFIDEQTRTPPE